MATSKNKIENKVENTIENTIETTLNEFNAIDLADIFDTANETKAVTIPSKSMQGKLCTKILIEKQGMNNDQVLQYVTKYTIENKATRQNWFKTDTDFVDFVNDLKSAIETNTVASHKAKPKYKAFYDEMKKKAFNLFFNENHSRVLPTQKWFASTGLKVDFTNKTIDFANAETNE